MAKGKGKGMGKGPAKGCWTCGGPHSQVNCPVKGKGKGIRMLEESLQQPDAWDTNLWEEAGHVRVFSALTQVKQEPPAVRAHVFMQCCQQSSCDDANNKDNNDEESSRVKMVQDESGLNGPAEEQLGSSTMAAGISKIPPNEGAGG